MKYEPMTKFEVDELTETMSRAEAIDMCNSWKAFY